VRQRWDRERVVLHTLVALVIALPLFRGGHSSWAVAAGWTAVVWLLALTVRARRECGAVPAPGVRALAVFAWLALATTLPIPPTILSMLSPATAELYAQTLTAASGGWRPLAIDPFGVWTELGRLGIALGSFAVVVAYPWRTVDRPDEDARERVFGRLFLTLVVGGALIALLGLVQQVMGQLSLIGTEARGGRASGPFVNPNHFAAWLEMMIPAALAYLVAIARRVQRRVARSADSGRGIGVRAGRAWISALVVHQRRLWAPLAALAVLAVMCAAHLASGSRAGVAALLLGLAVTSAGIASARRRWLPAAAGLVLLVAGAAAAGLWVHAESHDQLAAADAVDASLASRLAVAAKGRALVADHALFGTGLGSWLHAFRPYQAPPVDGGIWDHAHDDYLELAAETGVAGVLLAFAFALAVARAAHQSAEFGVSRMIRPPGFEIPEWREALHERALLRWGLAGGVVAMLLHSTLDFGLHMPANLLALMAMLALLVLTGAPRAGAPTAGLASLLLALVVAAAPEIADATGAAFGMPLSPARCLESADLLLAETGDTAGAEPLVRRALDRAPANREAHEMLARVLGPGPDGDAALGRAIALNPWSAELRDQLALRLWRRGEREASALVLEESMRRSPYLAAHGFLGTDTEPAEHADELVRVVVEGDTMAVRLGTLDPVLAGAVERGLRHALEEVAAGEPRAAIVDDLVALLEARNQWDDAAGILRAEADPGADGAVRLAHAARDYVKAGEHAAAEHALLTALVRTPERGELYRLLAVDVYGARKDFATADRVLHAGERTAVDLLPIYEGVTQVLAQRESARFDDVAPPNACTDSAAP
jgi:hypothetical protein